jgi:hypothetical protein
MYYIAHKNGAIVRIVIVHTCVEAPGVFHLKIVPFDCQV